MKRLLQKTNRRCWFFGIAAGLYPMLYFFSRRPDILTSWDHYLFFVLAFILLPTGTFFILEKYIKFKTEVKKQRTISFVCVFYFLFFLQQIIFVQHHKKLIFGAIIVAILIGYFLYQHLAKIVLLQLFLAIITMPLLVETILIRSSYSNSWTTQNDTIEEVLFQKKPNVYFIEPDGYSNFSELKKPTYDIDISSFENFLQKRGFSNYPEFRSNYTSTLASNASFFSMKHHYFNNDLKSDEVQNARDIIMYDNPVLRIFKNNGYKNYFVSDSPYLLANRPKTLFDETNFKFWDLSYIDNGIRKNRKDVVSSFKEVFNKQDSEPRFFFIQFIKPWHISGKEGGSKGVDRERELWTERLFEANKILRQIIDEILAKDPQGLIVIMADHGGYVGYNYSDESRTKTSDPNLITTIFSSNLSIHWPDGIAPSFENELDSSVNIFRILFSYLSNNEAYLLHMEDDSSYILLRKGTEEGIYSYIDDSGNLVFKKLQL